MATDKLTTRSPSVALRQNARPSGPSQSPSARPVNALASSFSSRMIARLNSVLHRVTRLLICAIALVSVRITATADENRQPVSAGNRAVADSSATPSTDVSTATQPADLAAAQEGLAVRYQRFENTLLQLAEYMRKSDPARADLLVRAIGKSKEGRIPDQFRTLVELLKSDQLGDATESQADVIQRMEGLLELLQSEDRRSELDRERQRIRDLIKSVDQIMTRQRDVRGRTDRRGDHEQLERDQEKISAATQELRDRIAAEDAARDRQAGREGRDSDRSSPADQDPSDGDQESGDANANKPGTDRDDQPPGKPPGDKSDMPGNEESPTESPADANPGDPAAEPPGGKPAGKPSAGKKPPEGEKGPSDPQPGADTPSGEPSDDSQKSPGPSSSGKKPTGPPPKGKKPSGQKAPNQQPGESPDSEAPPSGDQEDSSQPPAGNPSPGGQQKPTGQKTPGREQLQKARDEMQQAIEELQKNRLDKASQEQEAALAELAKAKEQLEEILRQLREEERELVLVAMEARLRDLLGRQVTIFNATVGLASVPEADRTDRQRGRAIELSRQEDELAVDSLKALTLLKDEGSSIAFPQALSQIHHDLQSVARRLEIGEVGELTQAIQRDIIEALEELVEAFRKEIEKSKDKKQQPQEQQQMQEQEKQLVDKIAELKLLRSQQFRVNRRTRQVARMIDGEQATDPDLRRQLEELSRRQSQIQRATYDLSKGKNE